MDEKEFNEWMASAYPPTRPLSGAETFWIKAAWFESARRADKRNEARIAELQTALDKIALYAELGMLLERAHIPKEL